MTKHYAWIIDHDLCAYGDESDRGASGPGNWTNNLKARLRSNETEGTRFILQDSDGVPMYIGRLLHETETEADKGEDWFAPLGEFDHGGATEIFYQTITDGFRAWVML